jgi:hypothetical protein
MSDILRFERIQRIRTKCAGAAILAVVAAESFAPEAAQARGNIPVLQQITTLTTGDIEDPRIRMEEGNRISFVSTGDVMGPGTETANKQVYLYDVDLDQMTQVTNSVGHDNTQASRPTDLTFASGRPEIIAFVSTDDLDPTMDNSDGNPEIFLWEHLTGTFHQLTDTLPPVVNGNPFPSDSGKCIAFDSTGDLNTNVGQDADKSPPTGFTNPDGSREVFVYALKTADNYPRDGYFTQASNGPAGTSSWRPVISGYWFPRQCQSTAYMSDQDQVGGSRLGQHIYIFNRPSGTIAAMDAPKETPNGQPDGNYLFPHISGASPFARGPYVVFATDTDLWENDSTGYNMFRYRVFHPRQTQYTDIETGDVERPVISDGGGAIIFQSDGEMMNPNKRIKPKGLLPDGTPLNPDSNREIFRQKGRRKIFQITESAGCDNAFPSTRDDGTGITWRSTCDLIPGHNTPGQPQIFLYRMLKGKEPLACKNGGGPSCPCETAERCCNEANGCYIPYQGSVIKPSKKFCLAKGKC